MIRLFRHYVPVWFLLLGLAEFAVLIASMYLGEVVRAASIQDHPWQIDAKAWSGVLVFAVLMSFNMTIVGLYQRNLEEGRAGVLLRVGVSFLLALIEIGLIGFLFPDVLTWRRSFLVAFVLAFWGILAARYLFFRLMDEQTLRRRVLVIGTGQPAQELLGLAAQPGAGFQVVGCVGLPREVRVVPESLQVRLDGPLLDYVRTREIDEVVVAISDRREKLPMHELMDCKLSGTRVMEFPFFYEQETGKVILEHLYPSWFIYSDGFRHSALQSSLKRAFDLLASLALLSFTWPVMLFTSLAIWLEARGEGDVLFRQKRIGLGSKAFEVIKFRSMRMDAEADGVARWATANDNRITTIGRFIRKTRIDELPQLWNVFKGEMSFVGPRPERPEFVETLSQRIPYYGERHRIRPGITGWAQVCYSYGASEEDAAEKLRYDLYYLKNHSVFLDFLIMLRTFEVVVLGRGAR